MLALKIISTVCLSIPLLLEIHGTMKSITEGNSKYKPFVQWVAGIIGSMVGLAIYIVSLVAIWII